MAENFQSFIEEAFIDPIRSVVIVDDDYPTIEEVLGSDPKLEGVDGVEPRQKEWVKNPKQVMDVVSEFRSKEKKYILDIHDAQNLTDDEEVDGAAHLHQTDLLVLDYQLDPDNAEDHTRSLRIARKLFASDHFNLIIVNTNKNLDDVFESFLVGLLESDRLPALPEDAAAQVEEAYEETDIPENFSDQLDRAVGFRQYASVVADYNNIQKVMSGKAEFAALNKLFSDTKLHKKYWRGMAMSAVLSYQDRIADQLNQENCRVTSFRDSGEVKWIRSDRGFITFSAKQAKKPLLDALRAALADWKPRPSRLFLAKMSADIENQGVEMQDRALADNHSSALWFKELLLSGEENRRSTIDRTVRRHIESMIAEVLPGVRLFADRLVESQRQEKKADNISVVKDHYQVDLSNPEQLKRAQLLHNALVCSDDVGGWHIQTGHIFDAADDTWICVSPLCDTVPAQISKKNLNLHGSRLRFTALKLHARTPNKLPDKVQSNQYLFFSSEDGVSVFSIVSSPDAMPETEVFYAENKGIFDNGFRFTVSRSEMDQEANAFGMSTHQCEVRYQLRYEYAQNLVQRLGGAVTRIGLDFAGE
ncbi:response regulator receiver domain [uncultured Ruegeria sp.]|uniref:response regulator receiver domain n=1 Tax=uncultured Ruegeria sp. TaxID=259304 RepID=UPI0026288AEC|nr:response regulator receiver domain [uncultured Ruegeria sp.]